MRTTTACCTATTVIAAFLATSAQAAESLKPIRNTTTRGGYIIDTVGDTLGQASPQNTRLIIRLFGPGKKIVKPAQIALVAEATGIPLESLIQKGVKDIPGSKDHPLLKRFEGSEIVRYKTASFDTLDFYKKDNTKVTVEGQLVRILFKVPAGKSSSLEVYRNYENELKQKGWELLNSSPPPFSVHDLIAQQGLPVNLDDFGNGVRKAFYIYAVKRDPSGDTHLDVIVAEIGKDYQDFRAEEVIASVDSIQVKPVANKMVDGMASDMAKEIAAKGRVNLYGIYFDFDKTDIKPESKPTLDEVGKLLNERPPR